MSYDSPASRTWEAALGRLQLQVTRPSYDTWLRGTRALSLDGSSLVVGVPTAFAAEWLQQRMHGLIETAVAAVAGNALNVSFHVAAGNPTRSDAPAATPPSAPTEPRPQRAVQRLNSRYSFDSFVTGPSNQLAFAASMAVADAPGLAYNPLFLYGASGLGKTHLLQAIGLRAQAASRTVHYVTCEEFTNDYLTAIRERSTDSFRARYRNIDVLLVDDVQFLSGKERTQECLFHTFNALHDAGRQIILSSDRPPSALPELDERLRSRFGWGLSADISPPEPETRLAILQRHAALAPVEVPEAVLSFIAVRAPSNIRHLEGCLNRLTALAHFTGESVTEELAARCLSATVASTASPSSPKATIAFVAAHYDLPVASLLSKKRDARAAPARHLAIHLLHTSLDLDAAEIGRALGGRDRTTILASLKKTARALEDDPTLNATVAKLAAALHDSTADKTSAYS